MAFARVDGAGYVCSPERHDVGGNWLQRPKPARRCSCAMQPMVLRSTGCDRRSRSAKVGALRPRSGSVSLGTHSAWRRHNPKRGA